MIEVRIASAHSSSEYPPTWRVVIAPISDLSGLSEMGVYQYRLRQLLLAIAVFGFALSLVVGVTNSDAYYFWPRLLVVFPVLLVGSTLYVIRSKRRGQGAVWGGMTAGVVAGFVLFSVWFRSEFSGFRDAASRGYGDLVLLVALIQLAATMTAGFVCGIIIVSIVHVWIPARKSDYSDRSAKTNPSPGQEGG